jgi:hypothetical protein
MLYMPNVEAQTQYLRPQKAKIPTRRKPAIAAEACFVGYERGAKHNGESLPTTARKDEHGTRRT